ncbi:AmiS/UreI family transporter [Geodermatophilus normandii]|uniref:Transporter n=1 Tax=Geodermatophilus normandii TaxID=1137989 RepID=A0A6P0G917_9ACTN|nr:AmiS/UreI family transporter [Geodermatophilus normandii]NEM04651.1 transporter [Geodermatophilus normandii]
MGAVGLLYVGAVLVVNGLMLLGRVDARAAAPLNLFVGALQVVTPTYLIIASDGDPATILAASGLYLFGFTYLYVGINLLGNLDGTGLGWFSAFVAACALVYAGLQFFYVEPRDPGFGVIWLYWAVLWGLFFLVLGLRREELTRFTGLVAVVAGLLTAAAPAFLLLTGVWAEYTGVSAVVLAVVLTASLVLPYPRLRGRPAPAVPPAAPVPDGAPEAPQGVPVARESSEHEAVRRTDTRSNG